MTSAEAMDAVSALRAAGDEEAALRARVGLAGGWAEDDGRHVRVGSAYAGQPASVEPTT